LVLRRWQQVKEGEGRVVLLAGEAGIGKSRLTAALEDNLKQEACVCLRYFCQPHHQGSALQPILAQLAHAAGFRHDDTVAERRRKLDTVLAPGAGNGDGEVALFAELLGLHDSRTARPASNGSAAPAPPRPQCAHYPPRNAGAAQSGADAVRGRALDRPDFARAADADHRAAADSADPARDHIPPGLSAAVERPAARYDDDAQPALAARSPRRWSTTSPAAKRCRRVCSTRSSSAPTACRCSSRS